MKTKKKAIRRVPPAAFLESDEVYTLPKGKQCSDVDLGTNSLQPNVDGLGVQLDSFSHGLSGLENATSDVCTGSSPTQHTTSQKRKKCDALPVNYDYGRTSGVLLHETLEAAATHTGTEHFTPISGTLANTTDECSMQETQTRGTVSLDIHPSCHPSPTPSKDKGKRKVYDTSNEEQAFAVPYGFQLFSESATEQQFLYTIDSSSRTTRRRCNPRGTPTPCIQDRVEPSSRRTWRRPTQCLPEPYNFAHGDQRLPPANNVDPCTSNSRRQPEVRIHTSSNRSQRRGAPDTYMYMGKCDRICHHCKARFCFQRTSHGLRADIVENLIEILDEHNELVQLFRTARDKMAEANIPEFKVRLFGVVGSNQPELPTGDSIGAIVFEGGPDVETDFDVVIE
ncbi:hypothetical protein CTI12_AA143370 [Artemisia annua]|uniref:Helitron helicase-like domain-containing protein n=1 Tax=Artemisia annua TaxID=35608 RepID=A0A2U1PK89_ARTAN|nr:hypothetical protein CTI12_AA143370 [Artemisia annua]